jgi:hypothetical protein
VKTIGAILYSCVVAAAVILVTVVIGVLLINPMDALAFDDTGYPIDAGYPIDPNWGPASDEICEEAPWMQPEMCDEYFAEPEPEIIEPVPMVLMIEPVIPAPIVTRRVSRFDLWIR